ncbi:hypothetical protein OHB01_13110 [Microbispora hainanensis]|jgi:hypothetical protein|uniref:DUF11 domain-containing protein n=1 Tax=Microbispora hainanensis TaxID=568844 RepID=A0ABZ1SJX4_9ACTN|nr:MULTISPECIES: hypothetical protein [Microbispora]NJP25424.1 hypothetical protein [Microbispora sp. CL1-1]TQS13393.1 hypothetical protein FLW53_14730 [Microbispora sp. SCL1-1]
MRTLIGKPTALLAVPLAAGALVASGAPASAASSAASASSASSSTAASAPVRIQVSFPYRARAGHVVTFTVKLVNRLKTKTDEIFLAVKFPKNVTKTRIYVPHGSRYHEHCTRERTRSLCVLPGLKKGKSYTFYAKAQVSGSARGKLYGYFGGAVVDTSTNTDPRRLLSEFGDSIGWVKSKSTITR